MAVAAAMQVVLMAAAGMVVRRRGYGYGYGAAALGLGLLGGAIIGSQYPYSDSGYGYGAEYDVDPQNAGGDSPTYCASRFRSYDPASGTYLGYDGLRHPCP